jgi:hypothetical protein|tara:strand:- start:332 stop:859 length:528 start_codon:yes stop_codon:yes gene_type:complete
MEYNLKKDGMYTVSDIESKNFAIVSKRLVQKYAKKNKIRSIDNRYTFTGYQILDMNKYYTEKYANASANKVANAQKKTTHSQPKIEVDISEENKEEEDEVTIPMEDFEKLQIIVKQRDVNLNKIEMLTQRIEEYQTDIKYFKDTLTDAMSSMKESLKSIQQQNFIQAKEKGFDKK